jgi:hypothetical protein
VVVLNTSTSKLKEKYPITDIGIAKQFLGKEINYKEEGIIILSQSG